MHMISRKDLTDAEMDTLTKSCSPTIVITANGEVQTHEEATVYVEELDIFLTMKVLEKTRQQYCRLESFAMKTDIPTNGSMVKKHISSKTGFGYLAIRRTSFQLWFQACQVRPLDLHRLRRHVRDRRVIPHHLLQPHLLHLQQVKFSFENEKMGLTVTPIQCKCQLRMMTDQDNLMKPKPTKPKNQIKRRPRQNGAAR